MLVHDRRVPFFAFAALLALSAPLLAQSTLKTTLVASGLNEPVGVTSPPGDCNRLFVVEKLGTIRIVKNGSVVATPFLDLTSKIVVSLEQGLLGLAFHPNYAANGLFFVYYSRLSDQAIVLVRYRVSANPDVAEPTSATTFLTIAHPTYDNHYAGALAFGPLDGYLYVSVGDGGSFLDASNNAQNTASLLGKILRLDVDHPSGLPYGIPPDNPFLSGAPGADEVWQFGLRNPWRCTFDRLTGDCYIGDVGQDGMEEIDFAAAGAPGGKNYGWRCTEGTQCTAASAPPTCVCGLASLTAPIYAYTHSVGCVVIGGYVYRGAAIPSLFGKYLYGDHCSDRFWSFQFDGSNVVNFQERTSELKPSSEIHNVTSFGEDAGGELYITFRSGHLMKVAPIVPANVGLVSYGAGTPGCLGPETLTGSCVPKIGAPCFRLECTRAPASTQGLCILTNAVGTGADIFGLNVSMLVDFASATAILAISMPTDATGKGSVSIAIPNNPGAVGATFYSQALFYWGGICHFSPTELSASSGLAITLQP